MRQIQERKGVADTDAYNSGIESVIYIRCIRHKAVPQENANESGGGECGACVAEAKEGVITAIIDAVGGTVDGLPTNRSNILQRVRELMRHEIILKQADGFEV